jgi:hypothetical protein
MSDAVRVVARFRPPNDWQAQRQSQFAADNFNLQFQDSKTVSLTFTDSSERTEPRPYTYDVVFPPESTQDDVFQQVCLFHIAYLFFNI